MDSAYLAMVTPLLIKSAGWTISLFCLTLILSIPLGLPFALGENSRIFPVKAICRVYVFIFRGTPLLLQLMFFYYLFPLGFNVQIAAMPAAVLTFVLNYAAYFAEIYRGGIASIDQGQYEAAYSLGLSRTRTLFGIIIPQAMRVVLPPMSNEAINLVKDTALASVITLPEIMRTADGMVSRDGKMVSYVVAALIYLAFTAVVTLALSKFEDRFGRYGKKEA